MFEWLRSRSSSDAKVEGVHDAIMSASRQPYFYSGLGVPDTVEGRLDLYILHLHFVLQRLNTLPAPAPSFAQELTDFAFLSFDRALREMGVGDTTVPKKIKSMASVYAGRVEAYMRGAADGTLELGLALNLLGDTRPSCQSSVLLAYVDACKSLLDMQTFHGMLEQGLRFPDVVAVAATPSSPR